jgi:hypothetical protein
MTWIGRLEDWWRGHRWWVILGLWLGVLTLGFLGLRSYQTRAMVKDPEMADTAYETLRLFTFDVSLGVDHKKGLALQIARFTAPLLLVLTTLQAFIVLFYGRWLLLLARLYRGHVVIAGYGLKGLLLARRFLEEGWRVVVIERDEQSSSLEELSRLGVPVVLGDATDRAQLHRAQVHRASVLVCLTGDDRTNAEVAFASQGLAGRRPGRPLDCLVYIVDPRLCSLLTEQELEAADADSYRLHFFNPFERGARIVLDELPPFGGPGESPRLLVIGLGALSQSFLVQTIQAWSASGREERLSITVVDRDAQERVGALAARYPAISRCCTVEGLSIDPGSAVFEEGSFLCDGPGGGAFTRAYVLLRDESEGLSAALTLLDVLGRRRPPILLVLEQESRLVEMLRTREQESGAPAELRAFGLLDRVLQPGFLLGTTTEILARAIHEEYVRDQQRLGGTERTNPSLAPWESLAEDLRESNRRQAEHIGSKLHQAGCLINPRTDWDEPLFRFTPEEVESLARIEHRRFAEEREKQGGKLDSVFIPWEALDEPSRELDRNAVRNIPALLARVGFRIQRRSEGSSALPASEQEWPSRSQT